MKQVPTTPKALENLDQIIHRHRHTAGVDKSAHVITFVSFINNGTHAVEKLQHDISQYHLQYSPNL